MLVNKEEKKPHGKLQVFKFFSLEFILNLTYLPAAE